MTTVLIVDDYRPSLVALEAVLSSAGYRVVKAGDGIEALSRIRSERPDVVIADILMPRMDGFEFIRHLRSVPSLAHIPVIFATATYDQPGAKAMAEACGVNRILFKPLSGPEVLKAVEEVLSEPSPASSERGSEFDHAHAVLLVEKLGQEREEMEARPVTPRVRPILVVEDNPMDLDFMLQAFEESNLTNPIRACRDGEEALHFIETHTTLDDPHMPLLVLLDLRLPKVDGIDVLRQARQHPVWRQIPFVVVTTSHENADISVAYELGVNSYIVKPVDFNSLVDVVKNIKVYWLLTNEPPFEDDQRRRRRL